MSLFKEVIGQFKDYGAIKAAQYKTVKAMCQTVKHYKKEGKAVAMDAYKKKLNGIKDSVKHITSDKERMHDVAVVADAIMVGVGAAIIGAIIND